MSTEAPPLEAPPSTPPSAPPSAPPSSGVSEPWQKDFIASDFTLNHKALERLPEHLKGMRPTLEKYRTFDDVLTGYQSLQAMAGKKALAPLPDSAPPEARAERKALLDSINGVPPKATDYKIERPADLPEAYWNAKLVEGFSAWAHENSVSPAACKKMVATQMAIVKEQLAQQADYERDFFAKQDAAFTERIRQENIPAERASELVQRGAKELGLDLNNPDVQTLLKNADVRTMAMRHAIAIGEDKAVEGKTVDGAENDPGKLASDAMHNPENPLYAQYWNRGGKFPRAVQDAAVTKVNEWLRRSTDKNPARQRR